MIYKCIEYYDCDGILPFEKGFEYNFEYDKDKKYYLYTVLDENGQKSFNLILYDLEIQKYFSIFEIRQRKLNELLYGK